jgi:tetratricopeptide (TPR) repeat protein
MKNRKLISPGKQFLVLAFLLISWEAGICQSDGQNDTVFVKKLIQQYRDSSVVNVQFAMKVAKQIYEMSDKLGYKKGVYTALEGLGMGNMRIGNTKDAMDYFTKALDFSTKFNMLDMEAETYSNMGILYSRMGLPDKVFEYFTKSLEIRKLIHDSAGIANSYNNIGNCLAIIGHYEDAKKSFLNALSIDKKLNRPRKLAQEYNNIAANFINQGKYDTGLSYLRMSSAIYAKLNDSVSVENNTIGACYWDLGKKDSAFYYYFKELRIAERTSDMQNVVLALGNIGGCYELEGNHEEAEKYMKECVEKASETSNLPQVRDGSNALAEIYSKLGNFKDAYGSLQKAYQTNDSILNLDKINALSEMTTKFNVKESEEKNTILKDENDYQKLQLQHKNILIYGVSFMVLLIVFIGFLLFRQNKIKASQLRLELEQKQFRAQMNPHFIFNCLNSIKHFIMQKDLVNAEKYLSDFAVLMRQTLNNSARDYITLRNEKEYIENYLSLERMRFDNKFDYKINIRHDIDLDYVEIPPMIIQPFVENAILHGLCDLPGKEGILAISFYTKDKRLYCEIDDNGIGREKALNLKLANNFPHKSFGTELTRQRLALIGKRNNTDSSIDVIDKSEAGNSTGTKVVIKFPD